MQDSQIGLSTRQVAQLFGVLPHVVYSNFQRKGHYSGIIPRKSAHGRLVWSANQVWATVMPARVADPNGLDVWATWARSVLPDADDKTVDALGCALLSSEATRGFRPAPGQFGAERINNEIGLLGLATQALNERIDEACTKGDISYPKASIEWLAKIVYRAFRVELAELAQGRHSEGVEV